MRRQTRNLMLIRRLAPPDAFAFHALRLAALRECPSAFSSSYEEECETPLTIIAARLAPDSGRDVFGAFDGAELAGMVVIGREEARKLRHKASIRGMYVCASQRGKGVGRRLLEQALDCAAAMPGLLQVNLSVTASQSAAVALYQAMGFTVFAREPGALMVDGVLYEDMQMVRNLPLPG